MVTKRGTVSNAHCCICDAVCVFTFHPAHGWMLSTRGCRCALTTAQWSAMQAAAYRASRGR